MKPKFKSGDVVVKVRQCKFSDVDFGHRGYRIGDVFIISEPVKGDHTYKRYEVNNSKGWDLFEDEIEFEYVVKSPLYEALK